MLVVFILLLFCTVIIIIHLISHRCLHVYVPHQTGRAGPEGQGAEHCQTAAIGDYHSGKVGPGPDQKRAAGTGAEGKAEESRESFHFFFVGNAVGAVSCKRLTISH